MGHSMSCTSLSTSVRKSTVTSRSPLGTAVKDAPWEAEGAVAAVGGTPTICGLWPCCELGGGSQSLDVFESCVVPRDMARGGTGVAAQGNIPCAPGRG